MNARSARGGFTLFEIILALAIVGLAMGIISQVVWTGMENARMTGEMVQAELLAESVMAELLAGVRTAESLQDTSFDEESGLDDPDHWLYSIDVSPLETEGLLAITVTVRVNSDKPRTTEFSLVRWVFEPEEDEESEEAG